MGQAVEQLQSLYQYLDRMYNQAPLLIADGRMQPACEQIAPKLCQLFSLQPALLQAQLALSSASHSVLSNLAMKQAVVILTIAEHGKWPLSMQEQVLSASFAALSGLSAEMFQQDFSKPQLLQDPWLLTIRRYQQQLPATWLQLFASCCRLKQHAPVWQQNPLASVLLLAYQLTYPLLLNNAASKAGFEALFRQQWRQATPLNQQLLTLLSHSGTDLHQLGRFCSDSIGVVAFITDTATGLKGYLFDLNLKSLSADCAELAGSGLQLLAPRVCRDTAWLELLVRPVPQQMPDEDSQPMSLAMIQQINPNWSVTKQVNFLQSHEAFCRLLCDAASQLSRQHNPITDVRHALALIGTEQLPAMLRKAWLAQQIEQCAQPWQPWFSQLELVFQHALQLLAQQTKTLDLNPNQSRLFAACVILSFVQHDELRHQPLFRAARPTQSLATECRSLLWQDRDCLRQIAQLLAATGFGKLWQDAMLSFHSSSGMQLDYSQQQSAHLLLQLAWLLTELCFFGVATHPNQIETLYKNARHALDLPAISLTEQLEKLVQNCAAYWPIQPEL